MIFKIQLRGTLEDKIEKKFSLVASGLLDFFYQASKPEPSRFPVWQIQSRYPGKSLRKDVSPNPFIPLKKKKTLFRKVAGGIHFGVWQFKQMIGIRFMFGRTTDLNHFQTIGTLEHLMPDVRWLEHTVL